MYYDKGIATFVIRIDKPFASRLTKKGVAMWASDGEIVKAPSDNAYQSSVAVMVYDPTEPVLAKAKNMRVGDMYSVKASYSVNDSGRFKDALFIKDIMDIVSKDDLAGRGDSELSCDDIPF